MPLIDPNPAPPPVQPWGPTYNPQMRCPVPPSPFTPDSSQQFYRGNTLPQFRAFALPPLTGVVSSAGSGGITNTTVIQQGGSTTPISLTLKPQTASLTTPVLSQGQTFTGSVSAASAYLVLGMASTAASRVRIYSTQTAQTLDSTRPATTPPPYATTQGLVADVTLQNSPYQWLMTPVPSGQNGDSPTTNLMYVTVGNDAAVSTAITVSLTYLPLT
jgi:hypothetical protein